jgi:hypothetical protein
MFYRVLRTYSIKQVFMNRRGWKCYNFLNSVNVRVLNISWKEWNYSRGILRRTFLISHAVVKGWDVSFEYDDRTFHPNKIAMSQCDGFIQGNKIRQGTHILVYMELVEMLRLRLRFALLKLLNCVIGQRNWILIAQQTAILHDSTELFPRFWFSRLKFNSRLTDKW